MFTKRQEEGGYPSGNMTTTVIAQGVKLEGDFSSDGDVLIEGHVTGTVRVGGTLTVGAQASVHAEITADQASVSGTIEGNMSATSHVELKSTAKLIGDLSCATVEIESGAVLSGRVLIGADAAPKKTRGSEKASQDAKT